MAGAIRVRVTGVGADTVVGKLIERVELAQALRPQIQTLGDRFAKKVVPSSLLAAGLVLLITRDPRRALTMLLVACPCAAGLATPTAVSASIGNSARRGILVKGGAHLESMATLDTVAFDKTGTLTDSQPSVSQVIPCANGYTEERVLSPGRARRNALPASACDRYRESGRFRARPSWNKEASSSCCQDEESVLVGKDMRCSLEAGCFCMISGWKCQAKTKGCSLPRWAAQQPWSTWHIRSGWWA